MKLENRESSRRWCRKRGLEEQRFYEMTKLRRQFSQLLSDSGLSDIGGNNRKSALTSAERSKRHGELKQLRDLKKELNQKEKKQTKVLKVDYFSQGNDAGSDDETNSNMDLKDVDFKISYDHKTLQKLYNNSDVHSFKDLILLKIILSCGLYPNVAIADEHNNYKPGSEQVFHTSSKPSVVLHPNCVFASHPEVLELTDADIVDLPGFTRHPASDRHQILMYVSLLETNKPYLVNSFRIPAAQVVLLFSSEIDTNADLSVIVCDTFIELKFPDPVTAQNLIFKVVQFRKMWNKLLEMRIDASNQNDQSNEINHLANKLEKELTIGLIDLTTSDVLYSISRLLAADVKLLHSGPGPQDLVLSANPFSDDENEPCYVNNTKGGVNLTPFLTYNCLLDTTSTVTTITSFDSVCPYCDKELHTTTLDRFKHMDLCYKVKSSERHEQNSDNDEINSTKKKYFCENCDKEFFLSIKDIFLHKKSHRKT